MARISVPVFVVFFALVVVVVSASGEGPEAGRLGVELTPIGAEQAGNADGSIPPWTGGLAKTDPIDWETGYSDPFAGDAPVAVITAKNADEYADVLSDGHKALLKRDARTFKMKVYPSRRSAGYPDEVLAEVAAHAGTAVSDGYHIRDVGRSAVPFPIPENGLQVMWNHVLRWRGGSVERQFVWAPVTGSGKHFIVKVRQNVAFDQHGYMRESREGRLYNATMFFISPPSSIGLRAATWEPIDPVKTTRARWVFIPQTLATSRVPTYEYDTIEPYTSGLRTADQNDGWNGAPDRFEWKLIGKKELLIGYNAYRLADRRLRYADIIRPHHLDPELLRYERHRVWVVEATQIKNHAYYRRVFYIDEDTWQVAQEEVYDKEGRLIRFGDHHMIQFYDVQVPWYAATVHHTMGSGAYLVSHLWNQEPYPTRWGFEGRLIDYEPGVLRNLGKP